MSGIAKGSIKVVDPRKVDQRKAAIAQNKGKDPASIVKDLLAEFEQAGKPAPKALIRALMKQAGY
jgi:hypothetical protein